MSDKVQEWLTCKEVAEMRLPGMPHSTAGVRFWALRRGVYDDKNLHLKVGKAVLLHRTAIPTIGGDDPADWLTADEIDDMKLQGVPRSKHRVLQYFRELGVYDNASLFRSYGQGKAHLFHKSLIADLKPDSERWFSPHAICKMGIAGFPVKPDTLVNQLKKSGRIEDPEFCRRRKNGWLEISEKLLPENYLWQKQQNRIAKNTTRKGGAPIRIHLERRPVARLVDTFPDATKITIDASRPKGRRIIVRMIASTRTLTERENA